MTKSKDTTKEIVPVVKSTTSIEIKVVDEIGGYVTPKLAAQMLGLELASMSAIIHAGKVESVKISGVVLIDKASVEAFAAIREVKRQEDEAKMLSRVDRKLEQARARKLKELLATMSSEAIDALLNGRS